MNHQLYLIDRINKLDVYEPQIDNIRNLFAHASQLMEQDSPTARQLMQYLSRLTDLIMTHEQLKPENLAGEISRVS